MAAGDGPLTGQVRRAVVVKPIEVVVAVVDHRLLADVGRAVRQQHERVVPVHQVGRGRTWSRWVEACACHPAVADRGVALTPATSNTRSRPPHRGKSLEGYHLFAN